MYVFSVTEGAGSSPSPAIFFPKTEDDRFDRINSPPNDDHCFDGGYVRKQPVGGYW